MHWQWVPDRRTKVRESTITFRLVLIKWNFEEAGVGTGAKRSRRRVQMQKVREISGDGGGDGVDGLACTAPRDKRPYET